MQQRPRIEREERHREPRTTNEARRAITETRSRISRDLDAIEDRIVEKRDEWRSKLDVLTPARRRVRTHPWPSLGIALGTGLVLGAIGGGEDGSRREKRRERKRRLRAERRDRLKERQRKAGSEERPTRPRAGFGRSGTAMLGGAVMSGLTTRMKRVGRQLLLGRR